MGLILEARSPLLYQGLLSAFQLVLSHVFLGIRNTETRGYHVELIRSIIRMFM